MKEHHTIDSHYLTYTYSLWKVWRMYVLNLGVKGLVNQTMWWLDGAFFSPHCYLPRLLTASLLFFVLWLRFALALGSAFVSVFFFVFARRKFCWRPNTVLVMVTTEFFAGDVHSGAGPFQEPPRCAWKRQKEARLCHSVSSEAEHTLEEEVHTQKAKLDCAKPFAFVGSSTVLLRPRPCIEKARASFLNSIDGSRPQFQPPPLLIPTQTRLGTGAPFATSVREKNDLGSVLVLTFSTGQPQSSDHTIMHPIVTLAEKF